MNSHELCAAAYNEVRRQSRDAIEEVMSGKFLSVGKEAHHAVAAALGRSNGTVRLDCLLTRIKSLSKKLPQFQFGTANSTSIMENHSLVDTAIEFTEFILATAAGRGTRRAWQIPGWQYETEATG
jgi:hypothetical protein